MGALEPILRLGWLLLRHPLAAAILASLAAVLLGGLRGIGLPRLFWSHRRGDRFLAGLAATLLAAEAFLCAWLLEGRTWKPPPPGGLASYAAWSAGLWVALLGAAAAVRILHDRAAARGEPRTRPLRGRVSPAIWGVDEEGPTQPVSSRVPVPAFLLGSLAGGLLGWGAFLAAARLAPAALAAGAGARGRLADPLALAAAGAVAALLLAPMAVLRGRAPAAVALCSLLGAALAAESAFELWIGNRGLGALALVLALGLGGWRLYKLRVPELAGCYREPEPYPPRSPSSQLLPFDVACRAWGEGAPRRLVVICTSGGGLRAATWTAGILGRLDRLRGFREAARLVTGASGGMLGAATWLARLASGAGRGGWRDLLRAVGEMESLAPVARRLAWHDVPLAFLPLVNGRDRGRALAEAWERHLGERLGIDLGEPLAAFRQGEEAAALPSLVFSPMLVEDGRRLILGNLDLHEVTDNRVTWLSSKESGARPISGLASRTGYHLAEIAPRDWSGLRLSTAARLSAAFPYASPAVLLPTRPRRRAVDAGYFDNYGLELACGWLRLLLERREDWLRRRVSGVLLIQIRDNVSELSVNPQTEPDRVRLQEREAARSSTLARGLEGLTSPPEGLLSARESVALFRNDALLESLGRLYARAFGSTEYLTTTIFEFAGEASLSWTLGPDEVEALLAQVASPGITRKRDALRAWLGPPA